MKRIIPLMLVALFVVMSTMDAEAQRKRKRRDADTEKTDDPFNKSGELYHEIKFGNVFIQNGFAIATKYTLGYSFNNVFSVNAGPKIRYNFANSFGTASDLHLFDWGATAGARAKITQTIYAQAEYGYHSVDIEYRGGDRFKKWAPLIGGGYISQGGPWRFGFEAMLHLNRELQDEFNVLEYWASLTYNF